MRQVLWLVPVHKSWKQCTGRWSNLPKDEKDKGDSKKRGSRWFWPRRQLSCTNSSLGSLFVFILDKDDQSCLIHKENECKAVYMLPTTGSSVITNLFFQGSLLTFWEQKWEQFNSMFFPYSLPWKRCGPIFGSLSSALPHPQNPGEYLRIHGPNGNTTHVLLGPSSNMPELWWSRVLRPASRWAEWQGTV